MKLLALVIAAVLALTPRLAHASIGFQEVRIPVAGDKPLVVGIWFPSDAPAADHRLGTWTQSVAQGGPVAGSGLPLVVISHGTGGWYGSHIDTAQALVNAGFVVAAISHTGDTYDDRSHAADVDRRPAELKRAIDYMLGEWVDRGHLDPGRVGVFGFSSGGFTGLVGVGGTPNFSGEREHCRAHPTYFDCGIIRAAPAGHVERILAMPPSAWVHDPRIRAAVIAAPALGFTFGREGLKDIRVPIQLWRAENDHILPNPEYAEAVRINLPAPAEYHLVPNADHFDFLAPCNDQLAKAAPQICTSAPGFDRTAFHADFDAQVTRFFQRTLAAR